jgi:hypothetical protein
MPKTIQTNSSGPLTDSGPISGNASIASDQLTAAQMKTLLFAHDTIGLWVAQLKIVSIPALIVGAAIGLTIRRWIACLLVSYAAALGLTSTLPHLHRPMSISEMMMWSTVLALPAILASMSLGYFAARWIQTRRAKQQIT